MHCGQINQEETLHKEISLDLENRKNIVMINQLIFNLHEQRIKLEVKIFVMDEKFYDELHKWQHHLSCFFNMRNSDKSPNAPPLPRVDDLIADNYLILMWTRNSKNTSQIFDTPTKVVMYLNSIH